MKRGLSLENVNSTDGVTLSQQNKRGKNLPALSCTKCSNICKPSDPKCDYCFQSCHLSCCGLSMKGAKLDVVVDILLVVGFTCGVCKSQIRNLLLSGPASSSPNEHEKVTKKMEKLTKDINEIKKQAKSVQPLVSKPTDAGIIQSSSGVPNPSEGTLWSEVRRTITKQVKDVYKRGKNIVVTGLPEINESEAYNFTHDVNSFKNLCNNELNLNPTVTMTRRVGHASGSTPRRLLVTVTSEQEVTAILRECRRLRRSADKNIAKFIYINPDLSPDDAKKAFEARKAKRDASGGLNGGGSSSSYANPQGSTLSREEFPSLLSSSQSLHPSSAQSLQSSSTSQSILNSTPRITKPLSPAAIPFVASAAGDSVPSIAEPALMTSVCSSFSGVTDSTASTSGEN